MVDVFSRAVLLAVGLVHLLPVTGVLGGDALRSLYGVAINDPNLLLLLRHRAVLFALLGIGLVTAAFKPAWTTAALVAAIASVGSFVGLAVGVPGLSPSIMRVVVVDTIALLALLAAAIAGLGRW